MLITNSQFSVGGIIDITVHIPKWLAMPFVWIALLYRRIRYGYAFRRIPLTQGKYAIVDPDDYDRAAKKYHGKFAVLNFDS